MKLIPNEFPAWSVDWVNKTFTFLNEIESMVTLTVDGVEYLWFTVNGNQITLIDAPLYEIYADYYPKNTATEVIETEITLWDIMSKVWYLLWQKPTSINFSTDIVREEINRACINIWRWRVVNKLNPAQIIRAGNLWFQNRDFSLRIKAWSVLQDKIVPWVVEIPMDTANLLPQWYLSLWADIVYYNAKTSDSIIWVQWVKIDHFAWERVVQLYDVPENFETPIWLDWIVWWVNGIQYRSIPFDNGRIRFEIVRFWKKILLNIYWIENNTQIRVNYVRKYENLQEYGDICLLPDNYWIDVLAYMVAWNLAYDKWLPMWERLLNQSYWNLRQMYQFFTNEVKVVKQKLIPKHYNVSRFLWWRI